MSVPPPYPQYYPTHQPGPARTPRRPVIVWDVVLTIVLWLVNAAVLGVAAFATIFLLAFIDYCPPQSCSVEGAFGGAGIGALLAILVSLIGLVVGIILMVRRRIAWWVATVALVLSAACWGLGIVLAAGAVGYFG